MPHINPDKGFIQLPAKRPQVDTTVSLPADWFNQFGTLIADKLLHLDNTALLYPTHETEIYRSLTQRSEFFFHLERHAGETSKYSLKTALCETLQTLYRVLADEKTNHDQKHALSHKLYEGVKNCTPGFHDRSNECLESLNQPEHLDDMLSVIRHGIVSMTASQATNEIHTYNRFFMVARNLGYGVRPLNPDDVYAGLLSENVIQEKLKQVFATRYALFTVLNALISQLQALVQLRGYQGAKESGYAYEAYIKFDNVFLKPFIGDLPMEQLFVSRDDDDNMVPVVTDINWYAVKRALLQKLRDEQYFTFTEAENALLSATLQDDGSTPLPINGDSLKLITNDHEISECLAFYRGFPGSISTDLSAVYLGAKLHIAAQADNLNEVKKLVTQGADVNAVLGILIVKHKVEVMDDPELRNKITPAGFNSIIPEGALAGKTVAEVWINSKRGRYWLAEDASLQTLLPEIVAGKPKAVWLAEVSTEKPTHYARWFSPESRLVKQFLQHVVYGEEQQAKALLETYPGIWNSLLHGAVKVMDYSNRQFRNLTAFQLALCALDNEMCDMLKPYMNDEEATRQYQAIFPNGYDAYAKTQQPFDFNHIVDAITRAHKTDVKAALELEQPNTTALWQALEQFRRDFTRCSQQEIIFNPAHLQRAFELHDAKCDDWNWNRRDLFWRQVVGYIQRFLPANIAQDVAQGLYYRVGENEKSRRSLNFRAGGGPIYPVSFTSLAGLGYEYADAGARRGEDVRRYMPVMWGSVGHVFGKLMSSKNSRLAKLMLPPEQTTGCVIS